MMEHKLPPHQQKLTLNGKEIFNLDERLSSSHRLSHASDRKIHVSFFAGKAATVRKGPRAAGGGGCVPSNATNASCPAWWQCYPGPFYFNEYEYTYVSVWPSLPAWC